MWRGLKRILLVVALGSVLAACRVDVAVDVAMDDDGSGIVTVTATADAEVVQRSPSLATDLRFADIQAAGWLVDGRITLLGAPAIAAALRAKGGSARLLGWALTVPGIRGLAGLVYPRIAANRHRMPGGTAACRYVPPDEMHPKDPA